mmetsp:Transcript_8894/g.20913  ORF Transcript_8894/g.20913 Transcript_8894/m.20913 type:complete len:1062 (-) Transcript_8894:329-3514(-)
MVGSPAKRALVPQRGVQVLGGGDTAAGPLTRRTSQVSAQLRAISLEYTHAELTTATLGWHPSRKLGAGCYGAVYRGELKDGSEVAIKAIDLGVLMGKGECPEDAGFDEEVQMLSKFRHPNLVTLLGWGQQGLSRYLVYEFLAGGDVFQRLHKSRQPGTDKVFQWHERLSVCLDAATGLSHMHNSTPKAFHRDIKSANILLDRHGTAKMADFGLSCTSGQAGALHITVKTISGTPGYKCPLYERTGRFTEGSEVYSFGMVLLEVLTGLDPSSADPHLPGGIIYPVADTIAPNQPGAIDRCARSLDASAAWPRQLAQEFGVLALRCVATHDERTRPHFVEIVRSLRSLTERYPLSSGSTPAPQQATTHGEAPAKLLEKLPEEESVFQLEVVMATGLDVEALLPEFRRMPLIPGTPSGSGDTVGAPFVAPVGRHHQPEFFEAWLPDLNQRSCISRKAFEVSWTAGNDAVWLLACGTNPMSVDGKVAAKSTRMPLRNGSEVCFTYELKVLLRLRFVVAGAAGVSAAGQGLGASAVGKTLEDRFHQHRPETREAPPSRWSVDRTYQLAGEGIDEHFPGKAVVLEGVASVGDAVERLNQGSINHSGGFCIVYSATKAAYFLLYQPGFRDAAFASLGVSDDAPLPGGSTEPGTAYKQVHVVTPEKMDTPAEVVVRSVVRMESTARQDCPGANTVPMLGFCLVCVHAEGLCAEDLATMPSELRGFEVPEGTTQVGRHHQPQNFEAWLPDPILRFCISRTHLELVASEGCLSLTNRSSNLLCIDREPAPKGEPRALAVGQTVSFARQEGTSLVHFLVLQAVTSAPRGEEAASPPSSARCESSHESAKNSRQSAMVASRNASPEKRSQSGNVAVLAAGAAPTPVRQPRAGKPSGNTGPKLAEQVRIMAPEASNAAGGGSDPQIMLELSGEGVLDVPVSRRTIGPVSLGERPLLVGRRHQPELHQCSVSEECLEFLSRDHFCVAYEGGEFWLLALTSNRIWRDRDGETPVQLARDDLVTLLPGDRIALGTGSDISSAELARRRLCWHFRRVDDGLVSEHEASERSSSWRSTV